MKRPGEPVRPKKSGGKALERARQFREQRGLPVEPPKSVKKKKVKAKPNCGGKG